MFEFGQIRNAIVHRGAHADRQLLNACHWLSLTIGDELLINEGYLNRYRTAAHSYVILLIYRIYARFGHDMSSELHAEMARYQAS